MHAVITRCCFATLVLQRLTGKADESKATAITFALDLFARLALERGAINVTPADLLGMATGDGDMRVVQMWASAVAAPDRPGARWRIQTFNMAGDSAAAFADPIGHFLATHVTPRTALVFDIQGQQDLTLHDVSDVAGLVYRNAGTDNDLVFGAVGTPSGGKRLGLALVALIPIA